MSNKLTIDDAFEEIKNLNDNFDILIDSPEDFNHEYLRGQVEIMSYTIDDENFSPEEIREELWNRINSIIGKEPTLNNLIDIRTEGLEDFDARDIKFIARSRNGEEYRDFKVNKIITDVLVDPGAYENVPYIILEF